MARRGALQVSLAVAGAAGGAAAAGLLLRPRSGVLSPAPVDAADHFSAEEVARARRFRRPQLALGAAGAAIDAAVLAALVRHPPRVGGAAGSGAAVALALQGASLPLAAVARRRSLAVGLATDAWRAWAGDVVKAGALSTGMGAAGGALAAALVRRTGPRWWLPGAAVLSGVGTGLMVLGPLLLDPIFNRFTPLPAGGLRDDVLELGRRAGVRIGEVYSVDASRRTTAINAYVTGLGPTKRVVLFDTLIDGFSDAETRLVVAHELGHVRHRDVARGLAFMALAAPATLRAVARLSEAIAGDDEDALIPALALAGGVAGVPAGIAMRALSRAIERRADTYALTLTGDPGAAASFERRVAVMNLMDPAPPRWARVLLATHPAIVERLGIAEAYRRGARA